MSEDLETKKFEIEKSYLTKEEFIVILNSIDFKRIKRCSLELITGCIINCKDNDIIPLSINIDID